jgi:NAD(P)-dependent dehydrogenase (short-subunit alcohol dehydrogenase family)
MSAPGLDISIAEMKKLFNLNFFSAFEMIQAFSSMLVKAGGCIVNNASIGGMRPLVFGGMSLYWRGVAIGWCLWLTCDNPQGHMEPQKLQ